MGELETMVDSEKIRRIEAEIKELDLDFMRGLISQEEYNRKAKNLVLQFIEAGGTLTGFAVGISSTPKTGKRVPRDEASRPTGGLRKRLGSAFRPEYVEKEQNKAEVERIEEEIRNLELTYAQGLISVGTFIAKIVPLRTKLADLAHRSAQHSLTTIKDVSADYTISKSPKRGREIPSRIASAIKRRGRQLSQLPHLGLTKNQLLLLLIIILAIVSRFPRVPHLEGYDGFVLISEAYSLLDGYAATWLITPASYFGMFTFSGYPIGSIAVLAFFLAIFGNLEVAAFFYIVLFAVLLVLSSYLLMKELFNDEGIRLIGVLFYVLAPVTYEYTYNNPTARAPFLALLPLCIIGLIRWCRDGGMKNLFGTIAIIIVMMLFHRVAVVLFAFLPIALFYKILKRVVRGVWTSGEAKLLNRFMILVFLVGIAAIFPISFIFLGATPKHLLPESLFPSWSLPYARDLLCIILDYTLFYGISLILAVFGIISLMRTVWKSGTLLFEKQQEWAILLLLLLPLMLFLPNPAYTRNLLSPFIACFAGYGTLGLLNMRGDRFSVASFLFVIPFIVYLQLYNSFWQNIEPYASIATILMTMALIGMLISGFRSGMHIPVGPESSSLSRRNVTRMLLIVFVLVTFTITTSDMQRVVDMDGTTIPIYVTDEEIEIASYIRAQQALYPDKSILLCSHEVIEHRISAYAASTCLSDGSGTALMEVGFVTKEDALQNSTLDLIGNFFNQHWYNHADPDRTLPQRHWFWIMRGNYSDPAVQERLRLLHIRFFVGLKGTNESLYSFFSPFESLFRKTITAPIVLETEHYLVYKLD